MREKFMRICVLAVLLILGVSMLGPTIIAKSDKSDTSPGNSGTSPGKDGTPPGKGDTPPGLKSNIGWILNQIKVNWSDPDNKVGIGTANPQYTLDVNGYIHVSKGIKIGNSSDLSDGACDIDDAPDNVMKIGESNDYTLYVYGTNGNTKKKSVVICSTQNWAHKRPPDWAVMDVIGNSLFRYKVGIGVTDEPSAALDVVGDIKASSTITALGGNSDQWNIAYGWGDHSGAGYLTSYTETDPVFSGSAAKGITSAQITNWNSAYGWGDHSTKGYLTTYTETDPVFSASAAKGITSTQITNWNTAYGWGDHSTKGYLTSYTETDPVFGGSAAKGITSTQITNWNTAYSWGDHSKAGYLTSLAETDPVFGASAAKGITSTQISNWNTVYSDRLKWNGGSTGLNAATGRTSLGLVSGGAGDIWVEKSGDTMTGTLNLPSNGLVAGTNQLVLSGGYVGIGTSSPGAMLDVEVTSGGAATIGHSSNSATGNYAIALGFNTNASGNYSIAMGIHTHSSGKVSTTMGAETKASGNYSIAMGYRTTANGTRSTSMGRFTVASGGSSTAMGEFSKASGFASTAIGFATNAKGFYSTAIGRGTHASGNASISIGYRTSSSGEYSTAMGEYTQATGKDSVSMGYKTYADGEYSMAMGNTIEVKGKNSIGIGLSYKPIRWKMTQDNTMAIMGGKVGIGTVSPDYKLSIGDDKKERLHFSAKTNPTNPPAGSLVIYCDGTDLKVKNSSGSVQIIADFP
ncbi:MAG: hypothetical protein JSV49_05635 [Thermoplasmata archaeon]|nr:MAG: hypothetical protein JSV49_05635 [Thermoplasmata archaeon]